MGSVDVCIWVRFGMANLSGSCPNERPRCECEAIDMLLEGGGPRVISPSPCSVQRNPGITFVVGLPHMSLSMTS